MILKRKVLRFDFRKQSQPPTSASMTNWAGDQSRHSSWIHTEVITLPMEEIEEKTQTIFFSGLPNSYTSGFWFYQLLFKKKRKENYISNLSWERNWIRNAPTLASSEFVLVCVEHVYVLSMYYVWACVFFLPKIWQTTPRAVKSSFLLRH